MKTLIRSTAAFKTFANDVNSNRISHAYLLHFDDEQNMREALKYFALEFFSFDEESVSGKRLLNENLPDMRICPERGGKITVASANDIVAESALKPVEQDKKLYIVCGIDEATPLVQNKLLKSLEEPPSHVYYLLGACSLAPVIDTVLSRVKVLTVPPFGEEQIFSALQRISPDEKNRKIAQSCGGIFGMAQKMKSEDYDEIYRIATRICLAEIKDAGEISQKYGNVPYKRELLCQINYLLGEALKERVRGRATGDVSKKYTQHTLIYALQKLNEANADLTFNASFQGVIFDFIVCVAEENDKWQKLRG